MNTENTDRTMKEDDILRFIAAIATLAMLPDRAPADDDLLAMTGIVCLTRGVERMLHAPFSNALLEEERKGMLKKAQEYAEAYYLPTAILEKAGLALALSVGTWVAKYGNEALKQYGAKPYEVSKELAKEMGVTGKVMRLRRQP